MISICIPVYNGEKFLAESLESVRQQTTDNINVEVVVCDDGSTDSSVEIIREFSKKMALRFFHNSQNMGLVGNWNRCLQAATGQWVQFAFQDDVLEPHCTARLLQKAQQTTKPIVACHRNFLFDANAKESSKDFFTNRLRTFDSLAPGQTDFSDEAFSKLVITNLFYNFIGEPPAVLFRRDMLFRYGVFNSRLIQLCDYEFWVRVASNEGMAYLPEKLVNFRVHGESTTAANSRRKANYLQYIEFTALLHDFAFSPHFSTLRQHDKQQRITGELQLQNDKVNKVLKDKTLASNFRQQLQAFLRAYPALRYLPAFEQPLLRRLKNRIAQRLSF